MMDAQPFKHIQVFYDGLGNTAIGWLLDDRFDDPFPHTFELQFSKSNVGFSANEYETISSGMDVTHLYDNVLRTIGTTGFANYRVKLNTPAGTYLSPVKGLGGNIAPSNIPILKEILRKEKLAMRKDRGAALGYLFKRRYYGPRCSCIDKNTGTLVSNACVECAGTGFKFGYFPGVEFPILISNPESRTTHTNVGTSDVRSMSARCLSFPSADVKDIWMEKDTSRVFSIAAATALSRYSLETIAVNVELRELSMADTVSVLVSSVKLNSNNLSVESTASIVLETINSSSANPFRDAQ